MRKDRYIEAFISAYIECALWSSTDNTRDDGGDPLDDNFGVDDLSPSCLAEMSRECASFVASNWTDLAALSPEQAGHDFWLTRNGHGAGFWDRGLGELGERLTKASKAYGEVYLYVHEGQIHAS